LGALIEGADLLLTNNTGPAHLAAALGTPVVDLYALTHPQQTPWRVPARVISHAVECRNCMKRVCPQQHHACLHRIDTNRVVGAALELLAEQRPRAQASAASAH
jgi:ADP-heptose:LPS heptosyltransferase